MTEETRQPRILFYDIECTNLKANFGYVLCMGYKWSFEKKPHIISIRDYPLFKRDVTNDKQVVREAKKIMESADMIVGHYESRFDYPFLQTRLLMHNIPVIPPIPRVDTWRVARNGLMLNSNRLETLTQFLDAAKKTPLSGPQWIRAQAGHVNSLRYVEKHCYADVIALEEVYNKIRILARDHPNVSIMANGNLSGCPVCGATEGIHKRGFIIARTSQRQRYWCSACGSWARGRSERLPNVGGDTIR